MAAGGTPNFATTPASSRSSRVRRLSCKTRVPRTLCARSLSGVQMITRSTRVSSSSAAAAAASASSASNSTMGQTTTPITLSDSSRIGNCESEIRRHAGGRLVAAPELVAERLDDMVGRDADVRRAFVDHAENRAQHAADGGHFATLGIFAEGQRVVVPEQLVSAVNQMDVQGRLGTKGIKRYANGVVGEDRNIGQ